MHLTLETERLILAKGKFEDWKDMYENVWSQKETAEYLFWEITENEEDAKERMRRTIAFQAAHPYAWTVYEKKSGTAIGYAGMEEAENNTYRETGICLGRKYIRLGYGREILSALIDLALNRLHAGNFIYACRAENTASTALCRSFGFRLVSSGETEWPDGNRYILNTYMLR